MHKSRNSLLVMLVLVTVALTVLASNAPARTSIVVDPTTPGVTKPGSSWSSGEPDGSGSGAPLPGQNPTKLSSGASRDMKPPVSVTGKVSNWVRWASRIWAARNLGV